MLRLQNTISASGHAAGLDPVRHSPSPLPLIPSRSELASIVSPLQGLSSFIRPITHYFRHDIFTQQFPAELGVGLLSGLVGGGLGRFVRNRKTGTQ
ncbi:MAG: hypothetical protein HQM15_11685 [Deltaproteobacteria bacterium]|nr:hypothetical protein [Deltaproteobacteria bacterium]